MTGYFAHGRHQRYPYYRCFRRWCPTRPKSYPASNVHDEFSQYLAETTLPHYLARAFVTQLVGAQGESVEQRRRTAAGRHDEKQSCERDLQELIGMRTARLIGDEEFIAQRAHLRARIRQLESKREDDNAPFLTELDLHELSSTVTDLEAAWRQMPPGARRGFENLMFPVGYTFQKIRTAEKGLLFSTFPHSDDALSKVVPLIKQNLNALLLDIHKLLTIVRSAKSPPTRAD
jgi:hypothetical protein